MIRRSVHHFVDNTAGKRESFTVEIDIDMDILANRLARRVLNSKRGRTQMSHGAVKARIIRDEKT